MFGVSQGTCLGHQISLISPEQYHNMGEVFTTVSLILATSKKLVPKSGKIGQFGTSLMWNSSNVDDGMFPSLIFFGLKGVCRYTVTEKLPRQTIFEH